MENLTFENDAVSDPVELCRMLGLESSLAVNVADFPLLVPRTYLSRIRPGDPNDPLLVQVLPSKAELSEVPGYRSDPLSESDAMIGPGLLKKYQGRVLMVTTVECSVHCRFCFRRHFSCRESSRAIKDLRPAIERIAADRSIREVILSGGDPLTLPDPQLAQLAQTLADIPHLRRLRVHTRLPVMIPARVTDELIDWLRGGRLTTVVVVHINHPAEIDDAVASALGRLIDAGVPVLSQTVLLSGVNDCPDVLAELCERLVDIRVIPYYLHRLDPVAGAAHFDVPDETGVRLIAALRARLPGYAVPRYVRETPGEVGKVVLA